MTTRSVPSFPIHEAEETQDCPRLLKNKNKTFNEETDIEKMARNVSW
jgi:hypothetical protein